MYRPKFRAGDHVSEASIHKTTVDGETLLLKHDQCKSYTI